MRRILALLLVGVGCSRSASEGAAARGLPNDPLHLVSPRAETEPTPADIAARSEQLLSAELVAPDGAEWSTLIRQFRWQEARARLEALPLERLKDPLVRFAQARVQAELADFTLVREHLSGLKEELPELRQEIAALEREALEQVGPFDLAAEALSKQDDARSQLGAARALRRHGDAKGALGAVARAIRLAERSSSTLAEATCLRAELFEAAGNAALAAQDYRAVASKNPTLCPEADKKLTALAPKLRLTRRDRYERARFFADRGDVAGTERELLLGTEPSPDTAPVGGVISAGENAHLTGWAWFHARTDDVRAATLLEQAAASGAKSASGDRFHAARAWARAGETARAERIYDAFAKSSPRSSLGEQSHYSSARLKYTAGRFLDAKRSYEAYLRRYGARGRSSAEASYEQAVAELIAGDAGLAVKAFDKLARSTADERLAERYRELEAVATAKAGNRELALQKFSSLVRERPLSFAALASAARIRALNGQPVPPVTPAPNEGMPPPPLELRLPTKVRLLTTLGLDTEAESALHLDEARFRREYGDRAGEALCRAYGTLSVAARRYVIGQSVARRSALVRPPSESGRWLWDCVYPRPHEDSVAALERTFGLPRHLLHAVMRQESAFKAAVVSPANAIGLMQVIPRTAARVAEELGLEYDRQQLENPVYSLRLGAAYLRKLLDLFGHLVPTIAAYNAGPHAVSLWLESAETLPADLFAARIPYKETRDYVGRVLGNLARYAYVAEGAEAVPELELELALGRRADATAY